MSAPTGDAEGGRTIAAEFAWARDLSLGGLFTALGIVLPIMVHAVGAGHLGRALLPMYLPVLACGMLVSPAVAFFVGLLTPALSSLLTGMPPVVPTAPLMMIELSLMGLAASLLHRRLRLQVVLATAATLLLGRVVTGLSALAALSLLPQQVQESAPQFMRGPVPYVIAATVAAVPGLIMLMIVVPAVVIAVERMSLVRAGHHRPQTPE